MGYHQQFFYSFGALSVPVKHGFLKRGFRLEQYSVIGINAPELK